MLGAGAVEHFYCELSPRVFDAYIPNLWNDRVNKRSPIISTVRWTRLMLNGHLRL